MSKIKLTENKLNQIISECITEVLDEINKNKQTETKKQVKLTEAQLTKLVAESTVRILKESNMDESWFNSVGKGAGAFFRNGGFNAAKSAYNDARAADMTQKAQTQNNANAAKVQQIRNKYAQMKQQLQQQLSGLDAQMEQELAQIGQGQQDYSKRAQNFTNKAQDARKQQYNFWNPQNQQPMS